MVPHTAAHGDASVNAVSKQLTLSQVAQLPHHRFWQDTASQWYNLHCSHLHHVCSPHPLHLQHWQPRWNRLQLFLPHQLFTRMPQHQCLQHPLPHLCSHQDPAVPAWHQGAWSRKSRNYWPGLSMDLALIMFHRIHPQSIIVVVKIAMYYILRKGDAVLSLISFHRLVPQSADLALQLSHLFLLLVAHVVWAP